MIRARITLYGHVLPFRATELPRPNDRGGGAA